MTVSPAAVERAAGRVLIVALVTALCLHAVFYLGVDRKDSIIALTLQKPTLFLLLPLALVIRKERTMMKGYGIAAAALAALSLLIVGPEGIRDYPRLVSTAWMNPHQMPTCRGIAGNVGLPWLWPLLSVGALVLFVRVSRDMTFEAAYCMAIVGSLLISPNSYWQDLAVMLLPALYFSALGGRLQRIGAFAYFFPPTHMLFVLRPPWGAAYGMAVAAFLATIAWGRTNAKAAVAGLPTLDRNLTAPPPTPPPLPPAP